MVHGGIVERSMMALSSSYMGLALFAIAVMQIVIILTVIHIASVVTTMRDNQTMATIEMEMIRRELTWLTEQIEQLKGLSQKGYTET
jgi:hypothetical protein